MANIWTNALRGLLPERKSSGGVAVASTIPTWQSNTPQFQTQNYQTYSLEGYSKNEIVYSCIECICDSAAEPHMAAYEDGENGPEQLKFSPTLQLFRRPNPFLSEFDLWSTLLMHLSISGNAYIEKVRSGAGKVVELWPLRPDRMRVVPDANKFISGYTYTIGNARPIPMNVDDVIHIKNKNPLDDFYGLSPIAPIAARVDIDNWMRAFVGAFFQNAGVPAGMLTVKRTVDADERTEIQRGFRMGYGGPSGWHNLMIVDNSEDQGATYQPMGLPLGARGLIIPELEDVNESRIAMAFGVPLSIVGSKLGMASSSYANRKADHETFWNVTLAPIYARFAAAITHGLANDVIGVDSFAFDMSNVRALQEDVNELANQIREDFKAGLITREEARLARQYPEKASSGVFYIPMNMIATPYDEDVTAIEPTSEVPQLPPPSGSEQDLENLKVLSVNGVH